MPAQRSKAKRRPSSKNSSGGGSGKLLLGLLLGVAVAGGGIYLLSRYTSALSPWMHRAPTTTMTLPTLPQQTVHKATSALTTKMAEAAKGAPFSPSEDVFEAAANTYVAQCSSCHGSTRLTADTGLEMDPPAAQFFYGKHPKGIAGSSADVHTSIADGQKDRGMPAYSGKLTDEQIWQLSLLLKSSTLELPDPVRKILSTSAN